MKSILNLFIPVLVVLGVGLAGCDRVGARSGHDGHTDDAHAHGSSEAVERYTHFTETSELFLEMPPLVAGQAAQFAVHLTRLSDYRPLAVQAVRVVLTGGGAAEERFAAKGEALGLVRVTGTPRHAGDRQLVVEVETPAGTLIHALGPVTVFADAAAAAEATHTEAGAGDIVFTKEQQWRADFATAEVGLREIRMGIDVSAEIRARPDGEARIDAPTAGTVRAQGTFPRLGQRVKAGETLAVLVPRLGGDTDLATLEAAVKSTEADYALARQTRERMAALLAEDAVPERRLREAEAAEAVARAARDAARARRAGALGDARGILLQAPTSGVLAEVHVAPGTYVAEGTPLFRIVDVRRLWLVLEVPESAAMGLDAVSGVTFRAGASAPSHTLELGREARLVAVGGAVDPARRSVPVVIEFDPGALRVPVGLAVRARLHLGAGRQTLAVPAQAVLDEGGSRVVYVMTGGETFERRLVETGVTDGEWVEILAGLDAGSRVVSRGAYRVRLAAGATEVGHGHAH